MFTVQSNVSSHISRLEKELGVTLVDRAHGGLTEDGSRVVERARRVLREIDDITADMASRDAMVSGQSRIGVIGTTARWLMPQFLGRLEQQHPNVRAIIQDGATSTLVPSVLSGQLNAAVIHLPVDDPELVIEPLFAEDLLLLADERHPLAAHATSIHLADLDDVPLLLPPTGAALRRVLDRAAAIGRHHAARRKPRSTASDCSPRSRSTGSARRSFRRPRCRSGCRDRSGGSPCPNSPVVSSPSPAAVVPGRARRRWPRCETLRDVIRDQGAHQHGVHLDTAVLIAPRPADGRRRRAVLSGR